MKKKILIGFVAVSVVALSCFAKCDYLPIDQFTGSVTEEAEKKKKKH